MKMYNMENRGNMKKKWDVFISHASEDKKDFADEISMILQSLNIKVWYDSDILSIGDSLSKSIDTGLSLSKYGIVIISENFVKKGWPEYEFRSLLNREIGSKKIILPIWHKVKKETIEKYCPYLLDKFALDSEKLTINQIIFALIKVIKPSLYKNINREILWRKLISTAKKDFANLDEIRPSEIRHKTLPKKLLLRITNLHYSTFQIMGLDLLKMVDSFKRDFHPDKEIEIWELINLCYQEFEQKINDINKRKHILSQLLLISVGKLDKIDEISDEEYLILLQIWKKNFSLFFK